MSSMLESGRNKGDHSIPQRRLASIPRGMHVRPIMAACCPLCVILFSPFYASGFTTQRVVSGLDRPLFVTAAPGDFDRLFIVEQRGRIQCWETDSSGVSTFLDISESVSCCGEQGLLGLAFHPAYAANGRFFVNYTDAGGDTVIAEFSAGAGCSAVDAATEIHLLTFAQQNSRHNGGWIGFGPDGFLYIATGDGSSGDCDAGGDAQDPGNLLGKILRIDVDGAEPYVSPPGNPFVGQDGRDEVWALGLRNPWRCAFDRETGDFYIAVEGCTRLAGSAYARFRTVAERAVVTVRVDRTTRRRAVQVTDVRLQSCIILQCNVTVKICIKAFAYGAQATDGPQQTRREVGVVAEVHHAVGVAIGRKKAT